MEGVGEQGGVGTEDLARLEGDPLGSVAHGVDAALQRAARLPGGMAPALAGFLHAAKGRRVRGPRAALRLRGQQRVP